MIIFSLKNWVKSYVHMLNLYRLVCNVYVFYVISSNVTLINSLITKYQEPMTRYYVRNIADVWEFELFFISDCRKAAIYIGINESQKPSKQACRLKYGH